MNRDHSSVQTGFGDTTVASTTSATPSVASVSHQFTTASSNNVSSAISQNDGNNVFKVTDHPFLQYQRISTPIPSSLQQLSCDSTGITETTPDTAFVSPSYDWRRNFINLSQHIYQRGLLEGVGSDVLVKIPAWNGNYHLHRLILDQNPYFRALFQGGFLESSANDITLHFDNHPFITADSFDFVLTRLYGKMCDPDINSSNVQQILATCSFFQLDNMCEVCVEYILQSLSERTAVDYLLFADTHLVYGSDRICDAIFTFLCREAYSMDIQRLMKIPVAWLKKILHSDALWVPSEYHRYQFIKNVIHQQYNIWHQDKENRRPSPSSSSTGHTDYSVEEEATTVVSGNTSHYEQNNSCSNDSEYVDIRSCFGHSKLANDLTEGQKVSASSSSSTAAEQEEDNTQQKQKQSASSTAQKEKEYSLTTLLTAFDDILSTSIHYMHMTFEQLESIRGDINPFTGDAMVPDIIMKNALWDQIHMRSRIESAAEQDKTLNMTATTPDLRGGSYRIPTDDTTTYTGESALSYATSNRSRTKTQQVNYPSSSSSPARFDTVTRESPPPLLAQDRRESSDSVTSLNAPSTATNDVIQYSQYPPFRFSVEFKDVANLKRNVRVYSKTVFYAGSNWNMYIQKTKNQRKSAQLGVYLHRQSIAASHRKPPNFYQQQTQQVQTNPMLGPSYTHITSTPTAPQQYQQHSLLTSSSPSSSSSSNLENQNHQKESNSAEFATSFSRFSDKRKVTKTWFKIFCPSRAPKHALTSFQSSPDDFSVLQSWGWRSSVLCADEANSVCQNKTSSQQPASHHYYQQQRHQYSIDAAATGSRATPGPRSESNTPSPPPLLNSAMANLTIQQHTSFSYNQPYEAVSSGQPVEEEVQRGVNSSGSTTLRFSVVMGHI